MQYRFIGDVHGKWDRLFDVIRHDVLNICVGDIMIGFRGIPVPDFPKNFKFIRGNHDNPVACRDHPNYLGDFGVLNDLGFISGAESKDKARQILLGDWFENEQLSFEEMNNAYKLIVAKKPKIIVTHDAPLFVANQLKYNQIISPTRTSRLLDDIELAHKPCYWFFGHHHIDRIIKTGKTTFIALPELGVYDCEHSPL